MTLPHHETVKQKLVLGLNPDDPQTGSCLKLLQWIQEAKTLSTVIVLNQ